MLLVGEKLAKEGLNIGFLFTVGEEEIHDGAKIVPDLGLTPKILICSEPTQSKLIKMTKGYVHLTLQKHGKPSHSGYPELGVNALYPLLDVIQDMRHEDWDHDRLMSKKDINLLQRMISLEIRL
eukprot:UN32796